jgi:hypothetical protein
MTFVHGKNTYISLNAVNLSAFTNAFEFSRTADSHDVTTYGKNAHVKEGGLLDGTGSMGGIYDNTTTPASAAGPRAVIEPLIGTVVELIRRPEGTGSGKAQDTVDVLVTNYTETSPVADMVTWTCEFELSDDVNSTAQGA